MVEPCSITDVPSIHIAMLVGWQLWTARRRPPSSPLVYKPVWHAPGHPQIQTHAAAAWACCQYCASWRYDPSSASAAVRGDARTWSGQRNALSSELGWEPSREPTWTDIRPRARPSGRSRYASDLALSDSQQCSATARISFA